MKVFFDTNVYVAEALLGDAAETMLSATQEASWRVYVSQTVLDEIERVLVDYLRFSQRLACSGIIPRRVKYVRHDNIVFLKSRSS